MGGLNRHYGRYFIAECYGESDRCDGDMTWEVGIVASRERVCLCYTEVSAAAIAMLLDFDHNTRYTLTQSGRAKLEAG